MPSTEWKVKRAREPLFVCSSMIPLMIRLYRDQDAEGNEGNHPKSIPAKHPIIKQDQIGENFKIKRIPNSLLQTHNFIGKLCVLICK